MKARTFPNDGGYTLVTSADDLEQALVRFDRTAREKCGAGHGQLAKPETVDRAWHGSVWHGGETTITVQTTLTCRCAAAPHPPRQPA